MAKSNDNVSTEKMNTFYIWCIANDKQYLIDEWAKDLNGSEMNKSTFGYSQKAWWRCTKDKRHIWDDSISHRREGRGCPYCSNKRVLVGVNDLLTTHPKLAKEWDESNELSPTQVTYGSTNTVKWICPNNHRYEAKIASRSNGTGCPICAGKQVLIGFNDLATTHPEFAKEWHPTKNGDLKPESITFGCTKKVWWMCEKGHEWEATPNNRTNQNSGCPICSNKKVLKGYNDLASVNPRLAEEWHPTKNGNLTPSDVTYGYNNSVWWKCHTCGNEWKTDVAHRAATDSGCPVCAGKVTLSGHNDLATLHKDLLKEWDYSKNKNVDPTKIPSSSKKKVWWICPNGHSYETSVGSRARLKTGCPYCSNEKALPGVNDLLSVNPELASEFDYDKNTVDIRTLLPHSNKKVWWLCKAYKHSWQATVDDRTSGKGCPYCSTPPRKILKGFNDLFSTNPELKESWDFEKNKKDPTTISKGSKYKAHWICKKGHEWVADVSSRACNHNGCPTCAQGIQSSIPEKIIRYYLSQTFNEIEYNVKPQFLEGFELDIYVPSLKLAVEYDGSRWHQDTEKDKKKDSLCLKNDIKIIRVREDKCPIYDSNALFIIVKKPTNTMKHMDKIVNELVRVINKEFNLNLNIDVNISRDYSSIINDINYYSVKRSIAELFPLALKEWNYEKNGKLSPYSFKPNSNIKVWWKCSKCNHEWETVIESRFGKGRTGGCPNCSPSKNKVVTGVNDIATLNPELVKYWDYSKNDKKPEEVAAGSNKPAWWICDNGHSYEMIVTSKTKQHHKCPYCSNKKLLVGYNDLATTHKELCKEWHPTKNGDLKPTMVMKGTDKKVWWKCLKCNYEWDTFIYSRAGKRPSGCPNCYKLRKKNNGQSIND